MEARTVAVTGASGFLGGSVCRRLLDAGYAVRGFSRRPGPPGSTAVEWRQWPEPRPADDTLAEALAGCVGVIHLAARVHVMRETAADALTEYREGNVELTRRVLQACRRAGVSRFVHASCVEGAGECFERPITEEQPPAPDDAYGRSKLEAEGLVARAAAEGGLGASVLRFPLIYGPGVRANMRALFGLVAGGTPLPFGAVRNQRTYLYVKNAASALVAVLEHDGHQAATYLVSDGVDFSTPDLMRAIAAALGRRARLVNVPVGLLRGAARVGDVVARLASVPLTSAVLSRLVDSLAVNSGHLYRTVGWLPSFTPESGFEATARWYLLRTEAGE